MAIAQPSQSLWQLVDHRLDENVKTNGITAMVYIAKSKSNWNYESFLTYGQFKNNSSRISDGNTASYNNSAYGARFRVSRVLNGIQAKGQLAAYIDLHYLQLTQDAYKESGTNINVDAITPELGAAYVFNLGNRYADLQCYTEASTVPEHVYSQNLGGGTAKLSMGIKTTFSRTLDMSLKYDREIRNKNSSFLFDLKYKF